jgi:hypothetical protein
MITKQTFDFPLRPKLRLSEVERLIKLHRIIVPPLSRATLVNMCEDGTFETAGDGPSSVGWLVYEDSFKDWVRNLDGEEKKAA